MSDKYQWRPWPEEKPEEHETISGHLQSDLVLVTVINHENYGFKFLDIAKTRDGEWQSVSLEDGEIPVWCEVIAWMNLPEAYQSRTNLPKTGNRADLSQLKRDDKVTVEGKKRLKPAKKRRFFPDCPKPSQNHGAKLIPSEKRRRNRSGALFIYEDRT